MQGSGHGEWALSAAWRQKHRAAHAGRARTVATGSPRAWLLHGGSESRTGRGASHNASASIAPAGSKVGVTWFRSAAPLGTARSRHQVWGRGRRLLLPVHDNVQRGRDRQSSHSVKGVLAAPVTLADPPGPGLLPGDATFEPPARDLHRAVREARQAEGEEEVRGLVVARGGGRCADASFEKDLVMGMPAARHRNLFRSTKCQLLVHTCRAPSYVQRALGGEPQSLVRLECDTH